MRLPLRNVPVLAPAFALHSEDDHSRGSGRRDHHALERFDLADADTPVAVFVPWHGSATYPAAR